MFSTMIFMIYSCLFSGQTLGKDFLVILHPTLRVSI